MTTTTLFPYRTINGPADDAFALSLESYDGPIEIDALNHRLILTEHPSTTVELTFRMRLSVADAEHCLPLGGKVETSVQLGARVVSRQSRFRYFEEVPASSITRIDSGAGNKLDCLLTILLDPSKCRGKVSIEPLAVLGRTLTPPERSSDRAFAKGSILGWAETWEVIFDLEAPPPGRGIPIRWASFIDQYPRNPERHTDLFAIEDGPGILLNSAKAGLHETLHSRARTGAIARVRDMVNHQIVLQAWTSMIGASLLDFQREMANLTDPSAAEVLDEMQPWKRQVILDWAMHLVPGVPDVHDAVEAIQQSLTDGGQDFMTLVVPSAIQSRFKTSKSFDSMMVEFADRLRESSND